MNDATKTIYSQMSSVDRVLLWMAKVEELFEFQDEAMTPEDIQLLVRYAKESESGLAEELEAAAEVAQAHSKRPKNAKKNK